MLLQEGKFCVSHNVDGCKINYYHIENASIVHEWAVFAKLHIIYVLKNMSCVSMKFLAINILFMTTKNIPDY